VLDTLALFDQIRADRERGASVGRMARRFHLGLIAGLTALAGRLARQTGCRQVALSGGVMQNRTLASRLPVALERAGLTPLCHRFLPANDACVSLGQAAYGTLVAGR